MAVDFDGLVSKAENTTASIGIVNTITICAWVFSDGAGDAGFVTVIALDEARNSISLTRADAFSLLEFKAIFTGTDGEWTFPSGGTAAWHAVAVSYDGSSTANNPVARRNFASETVTEALTPTLVFTAPLAGYCVGNRTAQANTWNGMLQHVQVFDVILTADEMDAALRCPGSITRGMRLWLRLPNIADLTDTSGNGFNATGTTLADRSPDSPTGPCGVELLPQAMLPRQIRGLSASGMTPPNRV